MHAKRKNDFIRLVIQGSYEIASQAATVHGIPISDDVRLHHGLYWCEGPEEYREPDPESQVRFNYTIADTTSQYVEAVTQWFTDQLKSNQSLDAPGTLLCVSVPTEADSVDYR